MIILYHQNNKVISVERSTERVDFSNKKSVAKTFFEVAEKFPDELLVWCHQSQKDNLNISPFTDVFHHKKIMASYSPKGNYLPDGIGYVEQSPFIKVNKTVSYPTWQMSSLIGGVHASVLNKLKGAIMPDKDFGYFLNSLAKQAMPLGLFCYSEPKFLRSNQNLPKIKQASVYTLFKFVKQHYKLIWVLLLFFNLVIYEKRVTLFPFLISLFYKRTKLKETILDDIEVHSTKIVPQSKTIDVVIPTIGRKKYLYDVLKDLNVQTYLPKNVIIVEQNPDTYSESELDYLHTEKWNFNIKHTFTHKAGACNARNIALAQTESEWIFLADDDIRVKDDFFEKVFAEIRKIGSNAYTINCLRENEKTVFKQIKQWATFGSGCSIVKNDELKNTKFELGYEFGFGEDADFGMQLRNIGTDVVYLPQPQILHLKAPMGGFRTKPVLAWQNERIQPKPSPTVMLYNLLHKTNAQLNGYKTLLFIKFYKSQNIKNPFSYLSNMKKCWNKSIFWANQLKENK